MEDGDFDDWKPGKSKPSPRNFGNPHQHGRRPAPTGFGSSSDLASGRKGFFKNKRVRQCVLFIIIFALFSTYFSGSGARKERKRMESVTVMASSGSAPRRAGGGSAPASIGFDAASKKKRAEGKQSGYDVVDSEELLMEQRERYEHPPTDDKEEEEDLAATAEEEVEKQSSNDHPFAKNAYEETSEGDEENSGADDDGEEKKEEEEEAEDVAALAKTKPEIDGEFVPKGEEEKGEEGEEEKSSSSEHLESLKSNHEEMSAHPDIGKLVGAIPKEQGEERDEKASHLSAPPKPESNAPPGKKYSELALTKVPTENIGKPKDKVVYSPPIDVEEEKEEEKVEEAPAADDEEKEEEKTNDKNKEEIPEQDDTKNMMLDVSKVGSSEGFDFSAGLVATEEKADKVVDDAEIAATEKEEDVKEKELASEAEDKSQTPSPKEGEEETSSEKAEAAPIPAKKMKLPTVSDGKIDAFVKDGTLPAAEEEVKEEKLVAPVEPENDDVLDLKRAGMGDELGFDFAEGLKTATATAESEETEAATAEQTEEAEDPTRPEEEQNEGEVVKEQEGEKPTEGEKEDEN